jgi:hypothetical protein
VAIIKKDGTIGDSLKMQEQTYLFGRQTHCDVRVNLSTVSREHCQIMFDPLTKQATLTALSKSAPTLINTKAVQTQGKHSLQNGDVIDIGGRKFRFQYSKTKVSPEDQTIQVPRMPLGEVNHDLTTELTTKHDRTVRWNEDTVLAPTAKSSPRANTPKRDKQPTQPNASNTPSHLAAELQKRRNAIEGKRVDEWAEDDKEEQVPLKTEVTAKVAKTLEAKFAKPAPHPHKRPNAVSKVKELWTKPGPKLLKRKSDGSCARSGQKHAPVTRTPTPFGKAKEHKRIEHLATPVRKDKVVMTEKEDMHTPKIAQQPEKEQQEQTKADEGTPRMTRRTSNERISTPMMTFDDLASPTPAKGRKSVGATPAASAAKPAKQQPDSPYHFTAHDLFGAPDQFSVIWKSAATQPVCSSRRKSVVAVEEAPAAVEEAAAKPARSSRRKATEEEAPAAVEVPRKRRKATEVVEKPVERITRRSSRK